LVKPLKNPQGTVKIKIGARREVPAPRIIDDNRGTELRSLDDCFNLSPIFHSESRPFRKQEINRALVIPVAPLEKAIAAEDELQTVLCRAAFEEFVANSLWNEDGGE
jgi:hypothetical protein